MGIEKEPEQIGGNITEQPARLTLASQDGGAELSQLLRLEPPSLRSAKCSLGCGPLQDSLVNEGVATAPSIPDKDSRSLKYIKILLRNPCIFKLSHRPAEIALRRSILGYCSLSQSRIGEPGQYVSRLSTRPSKPLQPKLLNQSVLVLRSPNSLVVLQGCIEGCEDGCFKKLPNVSRWNPPRDRSTAFQKPKNLIWIEARSFQEAQLR